MHISVRIIYVNLRCSSSKYFNSCFKHTLSLHLAALTDELQFGSASP